MKSPWDHTILVVEDDRELRETIKDVLEGAGYVVATARNGQEALDYLRGSGFAALILLDLSMPVMDGSSFRKAQLNDPLLASIPVVACSASAAVPETVRHLNIAAYLKKPVAVRQLLATIRTLCLPANQAA